MTSYIQYGDEGVTFKLQCPICGRFVKADEEITMIGLGWKEHVSFEPNATCAVHGRVTMTFEGYYPEDGS